ncbi:MAG: DUF4845 domain-containing protein [Pseudomonadales bacterium]|nr:DUF4845 domain-containing protein [Pseudomonadales bacterium]
MKFRRDQKGLGAIGWLFMILLFGGFLTIGAKLFPHYLDYNTMAGVLDSISEIDGMAARRTPDIRDVIDKRFNLNNIRDFPIDENIEIKRTQKGVEIVMAYEVRVPLVYNVDLVASFDKQVALRN